MRIIIFLLCVVSACTSSDTPSESPTMKNIKYLALGDSYTIGESVDTSMRWPVQLATRLEADSVHIAALKIIAKTGWRTNQLIDAIEAEKPANDYDMVSLLIGVNNQYRNYPIDQYRTEFTTLLTTAVTLASGQANNVFCVSIPDYAFTPFGQSKVPEKITRELDAYNAIADSICQSMNIPFVQITDISRQGLDQPTLVAADALHPSGEMYSLWVDRIYSTALNILN